MPSTKAGGDVLVHASHLVGRGPGDEGAVEPVQVEPVVVATADIILKHDPIGNLARLCDLRKTHLRRKNLECNSY